MTKNNKYDNGTAEGVIPVKFNKHGSFYIRQNWPAKAIEAININPNIFSPQNEKQAMDELGLGKVMVKSLRYWVTALKIAEETKDNNRVIKHEFTKIGETIKKYDKYFQTYGSLWLLHYNLASNFKEATTWYWFFNEFSKQTFTREQFIEELMLYILHKDAKIAESSIKRDYNCLRQSYLPPGIDDISNLIEEGIMSFFSRTRMLQEDGNELTKQHFADLTLPPEILYYCILDQRSHEQNQISIESLYEDKKMPGRIFNISYRGLLRKLQVLENMELIEVFNRFGQHHIQIKFLEQEQLLVDYYRKEQ